MDAYSLLDSGFGRKLEKFGPFTIVRPCAQAVWKPSLPEIIWKKADAQFTREPENKWIGKERLPNEWKIAVEGVCFKISPTDFGHLGIFPEQIDSWKWIEKLLSYRQRPRVLNLFAYSGGSTLFSAKAGAEVCHLDASKGMVAWARENAEMNQLTEAPIRWIVEDVNKFLLRELKRNRRYDAIIFDPPSFGRGNQGEIFKIERDILQILQNCRNLLSDTPLFVLFSCHTPGFTPITMHHLMHQMMDGTDGNIESGEMVLKGGEKVFEIPSGTYSRWYPNGR